MAAPILRPLSLPARALLSATHFLYTFVIVAALLVKVTLLGAVGAWLPALQVRGSAFWRGPLYGATPLFGRMRGCYKTVSVVRVVPLLGLVGAWF